LNDYTINISKGGTMLRTRRHLEEGDGVDLILSFPGLLEPITLQGVVRWVRIEGQDKTVGVAFDFRDPLSRNVLDQLVHRVREKDPAIMAPSVSILIVEDNPHVARLISEGLNAYQQRTKDHTTFAIAHATDGKKALERLIQHPCDVLIVDIYLPVMDGATLISILRNDQRWEGLPIIAVSAGAQEAQEMALGAGADFFLNKPFRLSDILETMSRLLGMATEAVPDDIQHEISDEPSSE
jgi:uncharacterized protein (TIGR02266 family)